MVNSRRCIQCQQVGILNELIRCSDRNTSFVRNVLLSLLPLLPCSISDCHSRKSFGMSTSWQNPCTNWTAIVVVSFTPSRIIFSIAIGYFWKSNGNGRFPHWTAWFGCGKVPWCRNVLFQSLTAWLWVVYSIPRGLSCEQAAEQQSLHVLRFIWSITCW